MITAHERDTLNGAMTFEQVRQVLAHRFPFLMVDKVASFERGNRVVEAMAQAVSLLDTLSRPAQAVVAMYLGRVEAQFIRPVVPGDSMEIEAALLKQIQYGVIGKCAVRVDGQVVARAEITMGNGRRREF